MCRYITGAIVLVMIFSNPLFSAQIKFKGYRFEAYVIKSEGKRYKEYHENKGKTIKVRPNEEYSIVVRNPLPVRVAVAVSIDGLNSIDGKRTSPGNAQKWMIAPNSSITIKGWQTGKQTLRKFLFTKDSAAFAKWREDKEGKPFTRNLGVIGAAWFWNSNELHQALHPPQPFVQDRLHAVKSRSRAKKSGMAPSAAKAEARAGTGMGRQQQNRVTHIKFDANIGMYSVKDVLKVYYEFAKEPPEPLPFVDDMEDEGRFAPDMHK